MRDGLQFASPRTSTRTRGAPAQAYKCTGGPTAGYTPATVFWTYIGAIECVIALVEDSTPQLYKQGPSFLY